MVVVGLRIADLRVLKEDLLLREIRRDNVRVTITFVKILAVGKQTDRNTTTLYINYKEFKSVEKLYTRGLI